MGDRIVVLHEGQVRQVGVPREVYDEPADTFVATFLGSPPMNLLALGDLVAGVRPEHLLPAALVPGSPLRLRFRITNVEYLGSERILYGRLEEGRFDGPAVSRISASVDGAYVVGTAHDFAVDQRLVKFFDRASGKRVASLPPGW